MRLTIAILFGVICCFVNQRGDADSPDGKPHGKDFSSSLHSHPDAQPVVLPKRYQQAVKNAVNATEENVSRELTPILQSNQELIWRGSGNDRQVLVATWTTHKSYYPSPGTTFQEKYTLWVTAAPKLKEFCVDYDPGESDTTLPRRLEQLLGLPPNSGHKFVVELWVNPNDLYRPSADPEITDYEAQLKFPDVSGYVWVSECYKQWYHSTADARYTPSSGPAYPWTRLGYTYDWGNDETRVGLSEFVIRERAELTVHSVNTTENYGKSASPKREKH
ncbi:hypothetical protein [Novipirellula maiorica]|uniref:hypothetical protein n=1 Tax=Novipirellula maiorica TaxID=1265734 RepID=UPI00118183E1|nr:hypothetical protein [Rhodopirellula maiorica]